MCVQALQCAKRLGVSASERSQPLGSDSARAKPVICPKHVQIYCHYSSHSKLRARGGHQLRVSNPHVPEVLHLNLSGSIPCLRDSHDVNTLQSQSVRGMPSVEARVGKCYTRPSA